MKKKKNLVPGERIAPRVHTTLVYRSPFEGMKGVPN